MLVVVDSCYVGGGEPLSNATAPSGDGVVSRSDAMKCGRWASVVLWIWVSAVFTVWLLAGSLYGGAVTPPPLTRGWHRAVCAVGALVTGRGVFVYPRSIRIHVDRRGEQALWLSVRS